MKKIPYNIIKKNSRLTDFEDVKKIVIANQVKNTPNLIKNSCKGYDKNLFLFI